MTEQEMSPRTAESYLSQQTRDQHINRRSANSFSPRYQITRIDDGSVPDASDVCNETNENPVLIGKIRHGDRLSSILSVPGSYILETGEVFVGSFEPENATDVFITDVNFGPNTQRGNL